MQVGDIRVSVVIPSYNREKTIKRCIDSAAFQTYVPFEIIVVDDGSDDATVEIVRSLMALDGRYACLNIIRQNHKGAQAARNIGILNAKGEYIAFLDSDDEWMPEYLETQIFYLNRMKRDAVLYSDCVTYDERSKKKKVWRLPGTSGDMYKFLLLHQAPMFPALFVKKDALIQIGLLDEDVAAYQEWETSIRLAKNNMFVHINKPLFLYHFHDGDTISKSQRKALKGYSYIIKKHRNEILKETGVKGMLTHYKRLAEMLLSYNG